MNLNPLPSSVALNIPNGTFAYTVLSSIFFSSKKFCSNVFNNFRIYFRRAATFVAHVIQVFLLSTNFKVIRTNATRIIANMTNNFPFNVAKLASNKAMSKDSVRHSVSVRKFTTFPFPALTGIAMGNNINVCPKPCLRHNVFSIHSQIIQTQMDKNKNKNNQTITGVRK